MLQTMSTKSQKIPEKSKLILEFPIGLHYKIISIKKYCLKLIKVPISIVSVLELFKGVFPNKQLNKSMLLLEYYRNSPVSIIGRFTAFIRWKEKVFHQEFHVTNANSLPNLHSRDDCFKMEVSQTCYTVTGKEIHPPQPEPVIKTSQYFKPQKKMEEGSIHSIDPGSVRKSALTKWKI